MTTTTTTTATTTMQHVVPYCYKTAKCTSFIYDYEVGMQEFERCAKYVTVVVVG